MFPPEIIRRSIWLYLRFTLSLRDVEDLLAERGIDVFVLRDYPALGQPLWADDAADLRQRRPKPHSIWHLDEVYLKIDGRLVYLWRAVDSEGEVMCWSSPSETSKLLKRYAIVPERLVTDDLRSHGAAVCVLGIENRHERRRWKNNRAENRINRPDDANSKCSDSRVQVQRRNSCRPTLPSSTPSTSNAISAPL
jgi:putative transposase